MVLGEIFPRHGGFESRQQVAATLEPIDEVHTTCADLARNVYEKGMSILRPGVSFLTMEAVIKEAGYWHIAPMIRSLPSLAWAGGIEEPAGASTGKGARQNQDLVIESGMVFELEPNAQCSNHRVNIGGTVMVAGPGVEELNVFPTRMRVVR